MVAIFLIPGSSIIQFEVNEEGERRNSRLPGGQLVNILGGGRARFSFLRHAAILAAETATSQDNPGKEQAAPESWKHHHLRLFANSTPILKFYCRPATDGSGDISSANVLGNLERAETDISDGRLRFQRLVSRAGNGWLPADFWRPRSIHGSPLASLAFQARNYGIETYFFFILWGKPRIRNWYPYFLKNLAFFSLYMYIRVYDM